MHTNLREEDRGIRLRKVKKWNLCIGWDYSWIATQVSHQTQSVVASVQDEPISIAGCFSHRVFLLG